MCSIFISVKSIREDKVPTAWGVATPRPASSRESQPPAPLGFTMALGTLPTGPSPCQLTQPGLSPPPVTGVAGLMAPRKGSGPSHPFLRGWRFCRPHFALQEPGGRGCILECRETVFSKPSTERVEEKAKALSPSLVGVPGGSLGSWRPAPCISLLWWGGEKKNPDTQTEVLHAPLQPSPGPWGTDILAPAGRVLWAWPAPGHAADKSTSHLLLATPHTSLADEAQGISHLQVTAHPVALPWGVWHRGRPVEDFRCTLA